MENLEMLLIRDKWISPGQLEAAKKEAASIKKPLCAALVKLGFLSLEDINIFFAQGGGLPYVKISDYLLQPEIMRLIDEQFCRQNLMIPLFKINAALYLACANPLDPELRHNLERINQAAVELLLASSHSILKALDSFYGPLDPAFELENLVVAQDTVKGFSFWRESERLPLHIPVSLKIEKNILPLAHSAIITGHSRDISQNGTAIGLEVFLYLPKGVIISLEFHPERSLTTKGKTITTKGEIVYCRIEKGQHYFLGIKFTEITLEARDALFALSQARQQT